MKSVFSHLDYKEFLKELVSGEGAKRGSQAALARAMGCQSAYLSQILNGKGELTEDQAIRGAGFYELSPLATEYLLVLVRLARASTRELQLYLKEQQQVLLSQSEELRAVSNTKKSHLPIQFLQKYFGSWIPSTIHIATSSKYFQTPDAIAERLRLDPKVVIQTLNFLEEAGLTERKDNRWLFKGRAIHFDRDSAINLVHQTSRRLQALKSIEQDSKHDLHFSSIFTVDLKTAKILREDFLELIEKSQVKIHKAGTDEIYSVCVDLFRVV